MLNWGRILQKYAVAMLIAEQISKYIENNQNSVVLDPGTGKQRAEGILSKFYQPYSVCMSDCSLYINFFFIVFLQQLWKRMELMMLYAAWTIKFHVESDDFIQIYR